MGDNKLLILIVYYFLVPWCIVNFDSDFERNFYPSLHQWRSSVLRILDFSSDIPSSQMEKTCDQLRNREAGLAGYGEAIVWVVSLVRAC